jgi:hypothetical protein
MVFFDKKINSRLYVLSLILFFFGITNCYTQEVVSGQVLDASTKLPLPNTTVTLVKNSTNIKTSKTDSKGLYSFVAVNGSYELQFSFIGFEPFVLQKDAGHLRLVDTVFLKPVLKKSETVNINAQKPLWTMSGGKMTMHIAESGLAAGNSVWELLQLAPGVRANDEGAVSLNGKPVTIYIDGRPSYLSGEALKTLLGAMPTSTIEKMELISNPSAKYQAEGAAVINIKTNKIKKFGTNGSVTTMIGSSMYFRSLYSIDLNYRKNKINLYGGINNTRNGSFARYSLSRVIFTSSIPVSSDEPRTEINKTTGTSEKIGFDFDVSKKTTLGFLINGLKTDRDRTIESTAKITNQAGIYDSIIRSYTKNKFVFTNPSVNFYLKTDFDSTGKEFVLNADFYRNNQQWHDDFQTNYLNKFDQPYKSSDYRRDDSPTLIDIFSVTGDYTQNIKKTKLETGFKLSFIKTDNNIKWEYLFGNNWQPDVLRTNYFIYREQINAVYAGLTRSLKKWDLEAYVRMEQSNIYGHSVTMNSRFSKNYSNWFPSFNAQYQINTSNQLSLSYRKSISRPNYNYVNPFKIFRGPFNYFEGNPDMDPTFTHSLELMHSYKNTWYTTLSYDYIDQFAGSYVKQDTATKILTYFPSNYRYAVYLKMDLQFNKQITPRHYLNAGVYSSYFKSAYAGVIPKKNTMSYSGTVNYVYTVTKTGLKLELYAYVYLPYHDGFYFHGLFSNCNIAANKVIFKKKATLRLNITNFFGFNNLKTRTEIGNIYISNTSFRDTRSINLNFTYRFGNQNVKQAKKRANKISNETNRVG